MCLKPATLGGTATLVTLVVLLGFIIAPAPTLLPAPAGPASLGMHSPPYYNWTVAEIDHVSQQEFKGAERDDIHDASPPAPAYPSADRSATRQQMFSPNSTPAGAAAPPGLVLRQRSGATRRLSFEDAKTDHGECAPVLRAQEVGLHYYATRSSSLGVQARSTSSSTSKIDAMEAASRAANDVSYVLHGIVNAQYAPLGLNLVR